MLTVLLLVILLPLGVVLLGRPLIYLAGALALYAVSLEALDFAVWFARQAHAIDWIALAFIAACGAAGWRWYWLQAQRKRQHALAENTAWLEAYTEFTRGV